MLATLVEDPQPTKFEFRICRPDGRLRSLAGYMHPVYSSTGILKGFHGTSLDITGRVQPPEPSFIAKIKADGRPLPGQVSRRVPTVSIDVDGTLCNILQGLMDKAVEINPIEVFDWRQAVCARDCRKCGSSVCVEENCLSRSGKTNLVAAKDLAFKTAGFYEDLEPFAAEDMDLLKWHLLARRFACYFVATRRDVDAAGELGDARMQTLAWLEAVPDFRIPWCDCRCPRPHP